MRSVLVILAGLQALACQEVGGAPAPLPSSSPHVWRYTKRDFIGRFEWRWGAHLKFDTTLTSDGRFCAREAPPSKRCYVGRWFVNTDSGELHGIERADGSPESWEWRITWERTLDGRYDPDRKRGTLRSYTLGEEPYTWGTAVTFIRKGR